MTLYTHKILRSSAITHDSDDGAPTSDLAWRCPTVISSSESESLLEDPAAATPARVDLSSSLSGLLTASGWCATHYGSAILLVSSTIQPAKSGRGGREGERGRWRGRGGDGTVLAKC